MSRRNNVRGPTSALTEFLKESGITPTTIARRVRTQTQAPPQPDAGPSNARLPAPRAGAPDADDGEDANGDADEYNSDNLDEVDDEQASPKKRKLSKAAEAKLKAAAKAKAAKKKGKKGGSDDEYDDEDEDPYVAISRWKADLPKPSVGSFEDCARCNKQFTVTKYTLPAVPPPGWLCTPCSKASGVDPYKPAAAPRKRKTPADKRVVVNFEERRFPSLASLCIKLISSHIDDVEALGGIGGINMDEIAKAIARNRSLTAQNAPLFYDVQNTNLVLYDVTNLTPPALCTLASLNPNLTHLRLDFCGRMDNTVAAAWTTGLPNLKRIELLGPFLVRAPAWQDFFKGHPALEGFLITQSPRFDLECMRVLADSCPGLTELRLNEVGKMDDTFLPHIARLEHLTSLSLAYPGDPHALSSAALCDLLRAIGGGLVDLDLSGNKILSDAFLRKGLGPHAHKLTHLALADVPELSDTGVAAFFDSWSGPPLEVLNMARDDDLAGDALRALLAHSGPALVQLNINGWKGVPEDALRAIGAHARLLRKLDVGWCREMHDGVVLDLIEHCKHLEEIKVWGCQRLTAKCPRKRNVNIYGVEVQNIM